MDPDEVLDTKGYLSRIREWPAIPEDINPGRWLDGFAGEHRDHAVALLDSFVFISSRQTLKMFKNAVHSLSAEVTAHHSTYEAKRNTWKAFLDDVIFSAPTGEEPNPSDSGYMFQRLARKALKLSEGQLVGVTDLRHTIETDGERPLILVDDFAGSGNQFLETWKREVWTSHPRSLAELASHHGLTVYYVPLVCTSQAAERIALEAAAVRLRPAHLITDVYAAGHPDTVVFPAELRADAADFIRDASDRAGITTYSNGFWDLELALAFEHSIPDACLGVLWSEEGGWFPLMARS